MRSGGIKYYWKPHAQDRPNMADGFDSEVFPAPSPVRDVL